MTARTLALTALLVALLAAPAHAADFIVTATHDDGNGVCSDAPGNCTLRDAIAEAGSADTVRVPANTYVLGAGELVLGGDTIVGAGARTTIIDGDNSQRVIWANAGTNTVAGVTITRGDGQGQSLGRAGGGILVQQATLSVVDSTIADNEAGEGGGIANFGGTLTVLRSTISGNVASQATSGAEGGGLYSAGMTTLRNSTVSGNRSFNGESPAGGGGVFVAGQTFLSQNATIAGNQADFGSAIAGPPGGGAVATLSHTIVGDSGPFSCVSVAIQGSHNVFSSSSCGGTVADPLLGPLQNNGGSTDTHAIADASPAVNAGVSCDPTDQRGVGRVGACDIGAYETGVGSQLAPPPGGGSSDMPPPVAGKSVNVTPSGTVKVKRPGSNRFVDLTEPAQLPVGTIVDTLKGRVTLTAAGGQTATFYGGIFKIGQGKSAKPLTTLTLVEKLGCPRSGRASLAAKGKKKRRLWGDGSGKFRTKGKHSAATVVGTKWLVEDRCASTLTRVTKGRVSVRDFAKRKTVIVRAGKKYVARANKK